MNCTYHRAIKVSPYQFLFNQSPNFHCLDFHNRNVLIGDINDQEIDDYQDDQLIHEETLQLRDELTVQESITQPTEAPISRAISPIVPSSQSTNPYIPDEDHLPIDPNDVQAINTYFEQRQCNSGHLLSPPPITPPNLPVNEEELGDLSPHISSLQLTDQSLTAGAESSNAFRAQVHINQLHANERAVRQYGKQRSVKVFKVDDKVSVAVSALDRASTDDKRISGRIIRVVGDTYGIRTKYSTLDRLHPTSELMPLPDTIDLGIPDPAPLKKISLRYVSTQESPTAVTPVHCGCRDRKTWCSIRRCALIKAGVKCSVACHEGKSGKDNDTECPNIVAVRTSQRSH